MPQRLNRARKAGSVRWARLIFEFQMKSPPNQLQFVVTAHLLGPDAMIAGKIAGGNCTFA
jgi:hypothetical protein